MELDALREQFGGTVEGEAVQHGGGRGVVGQLGCAHVSSGASGHRAARALSSTIRERPSEARELHTTSCEGEQRLYRYAIGGFVAGVIGIVGLILAVVGVIGATLPILALLVAAACAFMARRSVAG